VNTDSALFNVKLGLANCCGSAVLGDSQTEIPGSNLPAAWTCAFGLCCTV